MCKELLKKINFYKPTVLMSYDRLFKCFLTKDGIATGTELLTLSLTHDVELELNFESDTTTRRKCTVLTRRRDPRTLTMQVSFNADGSQPL